MLLEKNLREQVERGTDLLGSSLEKQTQQSIVQRLDAAAKTGQGLWKETDAEEDWIEHASP